MWVLRVDGGIQWWITGYDTLGIDHNVRVGCQRGGRLTMASLRQEGFPGHLRYPRGDADANFYQV